MDHGKEVTKLLDSKINEWSKVSNGISFKLNQSCYYVPQCSRYFYFFYFCISFLFLSWVLFIFSTTLNFLYPNEAFELIIKDVHEKDILICLISPSIFSLFFLLLIRSVQVFLKACLLHLKGLIYFEQNTSSPKEIHEAQCHFSNMFQISLSFLFFIFILIRSVQMFGKAHL